MHETILRALNDIFVIPIPIYKYFIWLKKEKLQKLLTIFQYKVVHIRDY